ncbi:Flp family type IVb pilin [Isoalcanivorax indicus]|uniref:Flp family type IVb pilin n=1 Tax=Isoalcanivorax indicus TaxID=2202653 RepID=UPI000DB92AB9|nr:Flp family type IVb pilin [Isoalcanivorax indicus]
MIKQCMNRQRMAGSDKTERTGIRQASERGASAIEYVMIIAVIVLAVVIAFNTTNLGPWITETFQELTGELEGGGGG